MIDADPKIAGMVELDVNALDKTELLMLGMKKGLECALGYIGEAGSMARSNGQPFAFGMFEALHGRIAEETSNLAVELSARAIRRKAGILQEIKAN